MPAPRTVLLSAVASASLLGASLLVPTAASAADFPAPTNVQVVERGKQFLTIDFDPVPDASNHEVLVDYAPFLTVPGDGPDATSVLIDVSAPSTPLTNLAPGPAKVSVRAEDAGVTGLFSAPIDTVVPAQMLVTLQWTKGTTTTRISARPATDGDLDPASPFENYPTMATLPSTFADDLTVAPDGSTAYFVAGPSSTVDEGGYQELPAATELQRLPLDGPGGAAQAVTSVGRVLADPVISADGSTAYVALYSNQSDATADLRKVDLTTGALSTVAGGSLASDPTLTADGKALIAVDDSVAQWRLVRIDLATGTRSVVPQSTGVCAPSASPDGTRLAVAIANDSGFCEGIVGVMPVAGGTAKALSSPFSIGDEYRADGEPTWDAASSRIAYSRYRSDGTTDLMVIGTIRPDGSEDVVEVDIAGLFDLSPAFASVDVLGPIASVTAPTSTATTASSFTLRWAAFDRGGSGVATYDVKQSRYTTSGARTDTTLATGTVTTSRTVTLSRGYQYCFSVRATDTAPGGGNVGPWSPQRCISSPVDDASLTRSTGWFRTSSSNYFAGSALTTTRKGATLTRGSVKAKQVGVVVRTCSTCGGIRVSIGSTTLGSINTKSSTSSYKKIIWLPASTSARTGTLKLTTTTSAKVFVDGVVVRTV